jgi:predicted MPP superfamily phosphohydrolase
VIAGHTHGGQIRIPILGSLVLPIHFKQFDKGLFDVRGTKMYVSRGVGCRVPVRFRCPPEVTTFILKRG